MFSLFPACAQVGGIRITLLWPTLPLCTGPILTGLDIAADRSAANACSASNLPERIPLCCQGHDPRVPILAPCFDGCMVPFQAGPWWLLHRGAVLRRQLALFRLRSTDGVGRSCQDGMFPRQESGPGPVRDSGEDMEAVGNLDRLRRCLAHGFSKGATSVPADDLDVPSFMLL